MNLLKSAALAAFLLASIAPAAYAQDSSGGEEGGADSGSGASDGSGGADGPNGSSPGNGDSTSDTTNPEQDCPEGQVANAADGTCAAPK